MAKVYRNLSTPESRACVNGAVCECGCGSTRVRVIARQRGLAQSLAARRRVVEAWAL